MRNKTVLICISFVAFQLNILSAQIKKKINYYDLDRIHGLFYQPNTTKPYEGTAFLEFPNGKKQMEVPIKAGKIHGTVKEWSKNGKKVFEANYEAGVQVGRELQWYATGVPKLEISYQNGLPEGLCFEWHKNDTKKSKGLFVNGKEEGEHLWWYENGQLDQQANYIQGKQDGTVKEWYRDGQTKLFTPYKMGKREGVVQEWFPNGRLKMEAPFENDLEHGETKIWSKKGLLVRRTIYDKGQIIEDYNYSSGSIQSHKGYIQVFNHKDSYYKLTIEADKVNVIEHPRQILYAVDGMFLRLFDIPVDSVFTKEELPLSKEELLQLYVKKESELLQRETSFPIEAVSKIGATSKGVPYIHWQFVSPDSQVKEQKARTPQKEHYISIICNKQILNFYSIVTNSDEPNLVEQMLHAVAKTAHISQEPIDLNTIVKELTE